jgi:hypothetical protein
MLRRLIKILVFLVIGVVLLAIILLACVDPIVRVVMESQIRYQTGLEAHIGHVNVGLLAPTVTIEDFRLYNSAEFGGTPCLVMKELHLEYDRDAIRDGKLHLPLVRLNLDEVDVVQNAAGRSNFDDLEKKQGALLASSRNSKTGGPGLSFAGIDNLNITLGKARMIFLGNPNLNSEVNFHIQNEIFTNVLSPDDVKTIETYLALRTGGSMLMRGLLAPASPSPRSAAKNPADRNR